MEQPTASPGTTTWERFDSAVRPPGPVAAAAEPPRSLTASPGSTATARIGAAVGGLGGRLRSPSVTQRVAAADAVGRALQRAGGYFDQHDFRDIRNDAERLIVRRPILSVFLAAMAGYFAGRAVWR